MKITAAIIILACSCLHAQTTFFQTYGSGSFNDCIETSDSNLLAVGSSNGLCFAMKTNQIGDTTWTRQYGNAQPPYGSSVEAVTEIDGGDFLLCGATGYSGVSYVFILKINSVGDTIWTKKYYAGVGLGIHVNHQGNYLVNFLDEYSSLSNIMLLDTNGTELWEKSFDFGQHECIRSFSISPNDDIICVGEFDNSSGGSDAFILKLNSVGDSLWCRTYSSPGNFYDGFNSMVLLPDSNAILAGVFGISSTSSELWISKVNAVGDTIRNFRYTIPVSGLAAIRISLNQSNNGIVVSGTKNGTKVFVLWSDTSLVAPIHYKEFQFLTTNEISPASILCSDNLLLLAGRSDSITSTTKWLTKIDSAGAGIINGIKIPIDNLSAIKLFYESVANELNYSIPENVEIVLVVNDILGREIKNELLTGNCGSVFLRDIAGGIYLASMLSLNRRVMKSLLFLKSF